MQTRDEVEGFSQLSRILPTPRVYIKLYKYRIEVFYCFYKLSLSREKNAKLFVLALIKREILTTHKVLYTESCTRIQFLFCKNDAFQNTDFSHLKYQLKRKKKKNDAAYLGRFSKFQSTRQWVNKVKLSSVKLNKLFQIRVCTISARKAKHLTSQPCLNTLMQTGLSANQSVRTILVVL